MRKAVRAWVRRGDELLVMERNKFGLHYYILIGGAIDPGETAEQALMREVKEETGLTVKNPHLVVVEDAGEPYGLQQVYECEYVTGEPTLDPNSIEAKLNAEGKNLYRPMWVDISQFARLPFRSSSMHGVLLTALKNGFPDSPVVINSNAEITNLE